MIPKNLRLYVGGAGEDRKVLLENRHTGNVILFQADVCAELSHHTPSYTTCSAASGELSQVKEHVERVADVYACIGVLLLYDDEYREMRYLGLVTGCNSTGKLTDCEVCAITDVMFVEITDVYGVDKTAACKRLLTQGTFFFGVNDAGESIDITTNLQCRHNTTTASDYRFLWNRSLFTHPLKFMIDLGWFVNLICGSVSISTLYCGASQGRAAIISRVSSERAGARFQVRGVDDYGCVANFVETEQIVLLGDKISSFLQLRGSVPVFWEQSGFQVGSHKLTMTRGYELTQVAYDKHMSILKNKYGLVMILNLLSNKLDTDEGHLSATFQAHHADSIHEDVLIRNFDYHAVCKGGRLDPINQLYKDIETFVGFSGIYCQSGDEQVGVQEGVLRTNCLDCIDRTNSVQTFISTKVLVRQLEHISAVPQIEKFQAALEKCWHTNANLVSRTYCGTGALKTAHGKMSKITDATRSVKRTIKNNFLDDDRQEAIEDFLMYPDKPLPPVISRFERFLPSVFVEDLLAESRNYCTKLPIRVAVGTWNSNGGRILSDDKSQLADWLLDAPHVAAANMSGAGVLCDDLLQLDATGAAALLAGKTKSYGYTDAQTITKEDPDVIAVGLQELVDLTAGNIVSSSQRKRGMWSAHFQEILCRDTNYVLLSSRQLVGVCLYVFVKAKHLQHCTDICIDMVKTGMKGKTGNKGGVAISFNLYSTSLCFACAHLAAGQNNVVERNKHYHTISDKVVFDNGMELEDHDYVFWCGDFNYRIDYPNHEIRDLIKKKAWYDLQCGDQLTVQKNENKVFVGYNEGPLEFAPTYKYDLNSDYYDTSEKFRSPAWCDRVLWRCKERCRYMDNVDPGKLIFYGNTEIKSSDHRPVLGVIDIEVRQIDEEQKLSLYNKVFRGLGPPNPTVCVNCKPVPLKPVVEYSDLITAVLSEMQRFGDITLVRVPDGVMHFTFQSSTSAMNALQLDETEVANNILDIHLKSSYSDWERLLDLEPPRISYLLTPIEKILDYDVTADHQSEDLSEEYVLSEGYTADSPDSSDYDSETGSSEGYKPQILQSLPQSPLQQETKKAAPPKRPPPPSRPPPPQIPPTATSADTAPPLLRAGSSVSRPARPPPPPEYAPVLRTKPSSVPEDYQDYRANDPAPVPAPARPQRPNRPDARPQDSSKLAYLQKKGQEAKEFLSEKLHEQPSRSDIKIGEPFGLNKTSDIKQFDDGTYKITLADGRVIVYEKGTEPVITGDPPPQASASTPPQASHSTPPSVRPPRPSTRPVRPAPPPSTATEGPCLVTPDDIFTDPPYRPSRPSRNSLTHSTPSPGCDNDVINNDNDVIMSNPFVGQPAQSANHYEEAAQSDTIQSFDNLIYAESDAIMREIRSTGTLGSVIELGAPAPNAYDNINPAKPSRPPRPSRPTRPKRPDSIQ